MLPGMGDRKWYTTREAAKALGVSQRTVVRMVRSGELPAAVTGPHAIHVAPKDVEEMAHKRARAGHVA